MIERDFDIFTGSRVDVSISKDVDSGKNFFDNSFSSPIPNLASFPSISRKNEISTLEEFGSDTDAKLSGIHKIEKTELVVNEVLEDPHQQLLIEAFHNKTPLRFRNFYVISTDSAEQKTGYFIIYDAFVTSYKRKGGENAPVQLVFAIEPDGDLKEGVVQEGRILRQGDFGVGAGVGEFVGSIDNEVLSGNRFVTFRGSESTNPFSVNATAIHGQPDENSGWQMVVESTGRYPVIRARTLNDGSNPWVKVYTSEEKPTPSEINAVGKDEEIDFGEF
ncbi:TPA: hypothetical protein SMP26_001871 [Proteus mirabilis]|nr:hypothetical protein [Proteus mirabilis]